MAEGTGAARPEVVNEPPPEAASLPDVPGAAGTQPDVLAARAAAMAARTRLGDETRELRAAARRSADVRTRLRELPADIAEDPRGAARTAAVAGGAVLGVLTLRRLRRRRRGVLPEEIEKVVAGLGKNEPKVRAALDESFGRYLQEHGVKPVGARQRIMPIVRMVAVPVVGRLGRRMIKQLIEQPPRLDAKESGAAGPRADGTAGG